MLAAPLIVENTMRLAHFPNPRAALAAFALTSLLAGGAQAQQCPELSQGGVALSYSSDALYTPRSQNVLAGGGVDLAQCGALPGIGFVGLGPDFTLSYEAGAGRALSISATSDCDTVILVNGPSGAWEFDDDSAGNLDPMVWFDTAASGRYDIWVGTVADALCDATLTLETFD